MNIRIGNSAPGSGQDAGAGPRRRRDRVQVMPGAKAKQTVSAAVGPGDPPSEVGAPRICSKHMKAAPHRQAQPERSELVRLANEEDSRQYDRTPRDGKNENRRPVVRLARPWTTFGSSPMLRTDPEPGAQREALRRGSMAARAGQGRGELADRGGRDPYVARARGRPPRVSRRRRGQLNGQGDYRMFQWRLLVAASMAAAL